jgi:effector-binding domain-containing protein
MGTSTAIVSCFDGCEREMTMIDEPEIVQTQVQPIARIRLTVPRDEIREVMGPGYTELMDTLAVQGVAPTGPWLTHHLRMDPEVFDFEIGVPVAEPITPTGRVEAGELPAARVARTVYHGSYEGLGPAWGELDAWLAAEGHAPRGDLWEVYVAGPESGPDPSGWRTQLNRPLVG